MNILWMELCKSAKTDVLLLCFLLLELTFKVKCCSVGWAYLCIQSSFQILPCLDAMLYCQRRQTSLQRTLKGREMWTFLTDKIRGHTLPSQEAVLSERDRRAGLALQRFLLDNEAFLVSEEAACERLAQSLVSPCRHVAVERVFMSLTWNSLFPRVTMATGNPTSSITGRTGGEHDDIRFIYFVFSVQIWRRCTLFSVSSIYFVTAVSFQWFIRNVFLWPDLFISVLLHLYLCVNSHVSFLGCSTALSQFYFWVLELFAVGHSYTGHDHFWAVHFPPSFFEHHSSFPVLKQTATQTIKPSFKLEQSSLNTILCRKIRLHTVNMLI